MYFLYIIEKADRKYCYHSVFLQKKMRHNVYFVKNEMMCNFEIYVTTLVNWLGLCYSRIVFREYDLVIMCKAT